MPNQFTLLILSFIFMIVCPPAWASYFIDLKSPYPTDLSYVNSLSMEDNTKACPAPPSSPQSLDFVSIYTDKRHGHSIIDPASKQKYESQTKDLKDFERQIYQWIEDSFQGKETTRYGIKCTMEWLQNWADNDALLRGEISAQGQAVRKWTLASLSSHYVQIQDIQWLERTQKQKIENWLRRVATQVMRDYSTGTHRNSRNNNHQYWAAWGVMITGVALNDHQFYKWGIQNYKTAMKQLNKDGTLPLELMRESRAFHYHIFAISPLIMMAETAKMNGLNLYKYRQNSLSKLASFILKDLKDNQVYITQKTGIKQNLDGTKTRWQLAWVEIYKQYAPSDQITSLIEEFRPMVQRRIGGNLSRLYSDD